MPAKEPCDQSAGNGARYHPWGESLLHPPGAWVPAPVLPADAFGQTGSYDRSRLARLYGARRPVVARGPRGAGGRPSEAWTLVSPYPNRDLTRLESGTMLIVVDLQ